MSGDLTLVARFKDGEVVPMTVSSRYAFNFFHDVGMLRHDDETLLRQEIANQKENGWYLTRSGKVPLVAPDGYGMFVIDFMSRRIHALEPWESLTDSPWYCFTTRIGDMEERQASKFLLDRVSTGKAHLVLRVYGPDGNTATTVRRPCDEVLFRVAVGDGSPMSFMLDRRTHIQGLEYDLSPWTLIQSSRQPDITAQERRRVFRAFRANLEAEGFKTDDIVDRDGTAAPYWDDAQNS